MFTSLAVINGASVITPFSNCVLLFSKPLCLNALAHQRPPLLQPQSNNLGISGGRPCVTGSSAFAEGPRDAFYHSYQQ